ncbi:MAG: cupredoxin domain-containing protein [Longimicrobiaceae bacterium]
MNPKRVLLPLAALLALAACADEEPSPATDVVPETETNAGMPELTEAGTVVAVRLREWAIDLSRDTVPPGEVTFQIVNEGSVEHEFEVLRDGFEEEVHGIEPSGGVADLTTSLEPGSYDVICDLTADDGESHDDKGMRTTLVVAGPEGDEEDS